MKPLVLPQINLNGSTRKSLVEQQCDVLAAIRELQKAMQEASPNGRDYQTAPMGTFNRAQEAWRERWQVIEDMHKEIEAHALAIQDSGK
jgi:uncharacterized protein YqgV (UPF0045/DUF77 family)